jgi:hypothetical protein
MKKSFAFVLLFALLSVAVFADAARVRLMDASSRCEGCEGFMRIIDTSSGRNTGILQYTKPLEDGGVEVHHLIKHRIPFAEETYPTGTIITPEGPVILNPRKPQE